VKKTAKWLAMLLLAGCTSYPTPAPNTAQAELILKSNLDEDGAAPARNWSRIHNFFYAFADVGCLEPQGPLAGFRGFGSLRGPQESVKVPAGKRVYIRASSQSATHAQPGQKQTTRNCYNLVSFVPEDGQVYEMHQRDDGPIGPQGCVTTLRNMKEQQPTKLLLEHRIEGQCARLIGR
jgi:hypothetical protein